MRLPVCACLFGLALLGLDACRTAPEPASSASPEPTVAPAPPPAVVPPPPPVAAPPAHAIRVAGALVPVQAKVVRWDQPGGQDGYLHGPEGERFGPRKIDDPALAAEVGKDGWDPGRLARQVDQVVVHYDECGDAHVCQSVLVRRSLSAHFLVDADGTVYQTLDLTTRAWHATIANDRSVGIEIAQPGARRCAAGAPLPADLLARYGRPGGGRLCLLPVAASTWLPQVLAEEAPVYGPIHGEPLGQHAFTAAQEEALAALFAALHAAFPRVALEAPRGEDGAVLARQLDAQEFAAFHGVLGHFHVQRNKVDPGPAFPWERVLKRAREIAGGTGR